jgi:CubicO group peptidase (beta-lactamase class C family)
MQVPRPGLILCMLLTTIATGRPAAPGPAFAPADALQAHVTARLQELGLAGAGLGILYPDGSRWVRGFGLANLEEQIPATAETIALWASSSKVVTGAVIMKALEHKGIALDAPIQPHLPFTVANPHFPETPITFRMLLTHRSSLVYDPELGHALYGPGDPTMSLGDLLREYLVAGGRYYEPTHYSGAAPGTTYIYSNINASLLGYLAERIEGVPFHQYCRTALLQPLGIRDAGWFLKGLDPARLAVHYHAARPDRPTRRVAHYGWPGYPDGMFRASAAGMLRLIEAFLGERGAADVLSPQLLSATFTPQGVSPSQLMGASPLEHLDTGLIWRLIALDGRPVWSHTGNGAGLASVVLLDTQEHAAAVLWVSGGVLETKEGQAFLLDLIHRVHAEMLGGATRTPAARPTTLDLRRGAGDAVPGH